MKLTREQKRGLFALYSRQRESAERNKRPAEYLSLMDIWQAVYIDGTTVIIPVYGLNAKIDQHGRLSI